MHFTTDMVANGDSARIARRGAQRSIHCAEDRCLTRGGGGVERTVRCCCCRGSCASDDDATPYTGDPHDDCYHNNSSDEPDAVHLDATGYTTRSYRFAYDDQ